MTRFWTIDCVPFRVDGGIRLAQPHMAADAAVSLGVVLASLAIVLTGWLWLDPLVSLIIARGRGEPNVKASPMA